MEVDFPSIIVDSGSTTTRAGYSTSDSPSLILPSVYSRQSSTEGEYLFGDDLIDSAPQNEILTMFNDGVVYDWDAMSHFLKHIYSDLQGQPDELPLILTHSSWDSSKNKVKACEVAFEDLQVPVFSLMKRQLCTSFGVNRSNSIVVELGGDLCSITPIHNGKILSKGVIHNKISGNFLNLFSMNFMKTKAGLLNTDDLNAALLPRVLKLNQITSPISDSYKMYQISKTLKDFKSCILEVSHFPVSADQVQNSQIPLSLQNQPLGENSSKSFELPNGQLISNIGTLDSYKLAEPLLQPFPYTSSQLSPDISIPSTTIGISESILDSLKKLETSGAIYQDLLNNIIFTGSTTYIPNLSTRVYNDLIRLVPNYSVNLFLDENLLERNNSSWVGANILSSSSVGDFDNIFLTKREYEDMGNDYIVEKFK